MNARLGISIVLLLVIITFVLAGVWRTADPSYQGRPLSYWLARNYPAHSYPAHMSWPPDSETEKAIRQIGTNALPILIQMVQARDSAFKRMVMGLASKQKVITIHFTTANELRSQAHAGYWVLGSTAKAQVPELVRLLTNSDVAQVRQCAASALGFIGEEAKSAVPELLISAKEPDDQIRNNSLRALSRIHAEPEIVLPGLIAALDDSFSVARENAAIALSHYGPAATSAVPSLVRTTQINRSAESALMQIDPDGAVRATAKSAK